MVSYIFGYIPFNPSVDTLGDICNTKIIWQKLTFNILCTEKLASVGDVMYGNQTMFRMGRTKYRLDFQKYWDWRDS